MKFGSPLNASICVEGVGRESDEVVGASAGRDCRFVVAVTSLVGMASPGDGTQRQKPTPVWPIGAHNSDNRLDFVEWLTLESAPASGRG
jgi:hypothetical protein